MDGCNNCVPVGNTDCVQDCAGTWGGDLVYDECNICGGDNSTCLDCAGTPNGTDILDGCNNCVLDTSNACKQDCGGALGGG